MNVPTIVWDPEIEHYYLRGVRTTSSPYLTPQNGLRWKELADLEILLRDNSLKQDTFSPRKWTLEHMTDKASAEMFMGICESLDK